jgi:Exostosin family
LYVLLQVVARGCIPVIIQSNITQPFEAILPYWEFSIRLLHEDIPELPQILKSLPLSEVARLQRGLMRYYSAFLWDGPDARAYEYTLANLAHIRLVNQNADYS